METIKNYLENMFIGLPMTNEVQRAKEDLLGMMEDKYNELIQSGKSKNEAIGIVITEFGNLDELLEELNLPEADIPQNKKEMMRVTFEMAKDYLELSKKTAKKIGAGILLCICSPIVLILVTGMQGEGVIALTEEKAAFFGLSALFVLVASGVGLMIWSGMKMSAYEFLKKEPFLLDTGAVAFVKSEQQGYRPALAVHITLGVVLCILAVLPIFGASAFAPEEYVGVAEIIAVGFLLAMVSVAVFLFVSAGIQSDAFKILLQEEEYSPERKTDKRIPMIAAIYWPCVTLVYLGWSFLTFNWGFTWIIWPVAGILFGVIVAVISQMDRKNT